MHKTNFLLVALISFLQGTTSAAYIADALPESAPPDGIKFQPALDFDTDSCYNVAAIGPNGEETEGLPTRGIWPPQAGCREPDMLDKQNVYTRQRCNNGVCAHLYAYYFQKDTSGTTAADAYGHTHDWEHVVTWQNKADGSFLAVSVSQHKGYEKRHGNEVLYDSYGHPMVVYHKDGVSTHDFRFAEEGDRQAENAKGVFLRANLVDYLMWPNTELRDKMFNRDFGAASLALRDSVFADNLNNAKPDWINFDPNVDEPGTPSVRSSTKLRKRRRLLTSSH